MPTITTEDYVPAPNDVVVDLSWLMYSSRFAHYELSTLVQGEGVVPTGHIHGVLTTVANLALSTPRVILAVDSVSKERYQIFSEYKAGREEKRKDEYNIKVHQTLIIAAATAIPNVYFLKQDGYEADDLINYITNLGHDPILFAKDNDLFQLPKPFRVAYSLVSNYPDLVDVRAYILEKYGIDLPYLPIWYKTVRGDPSDNLSPGCPRYPSKKLIPLCLDLKDTTDFADFAAWVGERKDPKLNQNLETLRRNYEMVRPRFPAEPPKLKKLRDYPVVEPLRRLGMRTVLGMLAYRGVQ